MVYKMKRSILFFFGTVLCAHSMEPPEQHLPTNQEIVSFIKVFNTGFIKLVGEKNKLIDRARYLTRLLYEQEDENKQFFFAAKDEELTAAVAAARNGWYGVCAHLTHHKKNITSSVALGGDTPFYKKIISYNTQSHTRDLDIAEFKSMLYTWRPHPLDPQEINAHSFNMWHLIACNGRRYMLAKELVQYVINPHREYKEILTDKQLLTILYAFKKNELLNKMPKNVLWELILIPYFLNPTHPKLHPDIVENKDTLITQLSTKTPEYNHYTPQSLVPIQFARHNNSSTTRLYRLLSPLRPQMDYEELLNTCKTEPVIPPQLNSNIFKFSFEPIAETHGKKRTRTPKNKPETPINTHLNRSLKRRWR